ncbi:MAG: S-layer protein domain-containing protein, partial [Euryarchaeota archaeon]|nr:S-layer protein domain-containing protein [Euryarchaeota archaeon]
MNKNVILPIVALMILAMVGAASAAEVTTVDKVEIRGNVINMSAAQVDDIEWNCTTFAAFWYDIDDNLMTENLTIPAGTLDGTIGAQDREIDENALIYMTHPEYQTYELYENEGLVVEGDSALLSSGYYLEGWLSEKYVAVNDNADKLAKLLVEFEDDDKKTLATGEAWDLGGGFTLTANQIDLEGEKCWLTLAKDGKELDNEVVSTGAAAPDKNDSVYTYTADIANEDDIPVFSCLVDAVFRGTDTNIVQVMYVFLMDNDVLEIETSDSYGAMEVMTASANQIVLRNDETTLDLDADTIEHIMGNMYFKTADNDGPGEDGALRFYPYVEYTEPGTYEVRGNVINMSAAQVDDIEWNCTTFAAFWYDIDDNLMTENLTIPAGTLDGTIGAQDREIDENALIYMTHPEYQTYELYENEGLVVEGDSALLSSGYYLEGWLSEKYVAVNDNADKLAKLLVEFEDDDKKTLATGEAWDLGGGFTLTANQIDLEGEKCWLTLAKDGKELDNEVVSTGAAAPDKNDSVYTYTADIANEDDIPVFSCLVDAVFRGTDTNIVQVMYVFLMDNDVLEIETSDSYGAMEVMTASANQIVLRNDETTLDLDADTIEHIMGNMYFKTADNDGPGEDGALRFYPYVEYTIGGVAPAEPEETPEEEPEVEPTPAVNVTPAVEGTPGVPAEGEVVPTAEETVPVTEETVPEAEETPKKKVPGFEAVFAIAGLLAIAYLV